jgi:hypothetical protein
VTRKVAIVGSRTFPLDPGIGKEIVEVMLEYGEDVMFLTRGSPGLDTFVMHAAPIIERRCFAYPAKGGPDNFLRDMELVKDADEVVAFFDPATLSDPNTGTAHVVEKALDKKKPVRAYTTVNGGLVYVGAT